MVKHKYIYWLLLNLIFSLNVNCQERAPISFGISAGISASGYCDGNNGALIPNSPLPLFPKTGGTFSISSDILIYKCFFLQTGISYIYLRSEFFISDFYLHPVIIDYPVTPPPHYTTFLSTNNICIPLLFKLSRKKAKNNLFVATGFDVIYDIHSSVITNGIYKNYDGFIFSSKHNNLFGVNYTIVIGKYFHICKNEFFTEIQYMQDITGWNYQLIPFFNYPYPNPTLPLKNYSASINIGWVLPGFRGSKVIATAN
jgi:hypothetical protein